jgi:SAM-dependent methyltransferase
MSNKVQDNLLKYYIDGAPSKHTELCHIMTRHGSDKGTCHNYTVLYHKIFGALKNEEINIFELGLGTNNIDVPSNMGSNGRPGASLYGWREYFTKAKVYGADIDKRILFQADRIKTYYCDQRDSECIQELFNNEDLKDVSFDIIIDDGLHEFDANYTFLTNSIEKLKDDGIFIIEDMIQDNVSKFHIIMEELKIRYKLSYIAICPLPLPLGWLNTDNTLLIIQK